MSITIDEARQQATALLEAAKASPVRQYRYPLARQAKEWERAVTELTGSEDEAVIELAHAVVPGMRVPTANGWCIVLRCLTRDGQCSVHVEDPQDPRGVYLNMAGPTSPLVVKR